jgi:hypothetical protein
MTITNGYCTLADVKTSSRLNINDSDSVSDEMLEGVIEGVSRKIDDECHRFFYQTSSQTRWYTPLSSDMVFVDDIPADSDITAIAIDTDDDGTVNDTFATTDYVLEPLNAVLEGRPYQKIVKRPRGQFLFPKNCVKSVSVTAVFGWAAVPKPVVEACKLQVERIFMRGSTPLGSNSMTALGKMTLTIPSLDPDVVGMIQPYIKLRSGFG